MSHALVERAKARTGIETDTDLIEFALANIALEDRFAESFKAGTVRMKSWIRDLNSSASDAMAGFDRRGRIWSQPMPARPPGCCRLARSTPARRIRSPMRRRRSRQHRPDRPQPLLLDTCVYIDQMQGRAPRLVEQLIDTRQVNHSTVAIQELMRGIGVLDPPDDPRRTVAVVEAVSGQIEAMPEHRVFAPDAEVLGRAALLAGILSRLQGYARDGKLKELQRLRRVLLPVHRRGMGKLGFAVLTANVAEFDLLLQLVPTGRVLLYRPGD